MEDWTMNNSGIISQYGFLFQRKVFVLYILENINVKQRFCYEGKDDVEVASDKKIYALYDSPNQCIQVKSGTVDSACFCKVVGNWLLLKSLEDSSLILFVENDLGFEWSIPKLVDLIKDFVLNGKGQKVTSIANKVYNLYLDDIENNDSKQLKEDIERILTLIYIDMCSVKEIDRRLEEVFFRNHCQDIIEYELAKKKRLEKFIQYINQQIDDAIVEKKTYSLIFPELMRTLTRVCDEISDHKYIANVACLKKSFKDKAEKIVDDRKQREVKQLFLVDHNDAFVIDGIVNELFYKDFRDVYVDKQFIKISNMEQFAKENFDEALFEIEGEPTPRELYLKTTSKVIESDILPNGPMYRKGCYIYLTGDDINDDTQLTWGKYNETE